MNIIINKKEYQIEEISCGLAAFAAEAGIVFSPLAFLSWQESEQTDDNL